MNLRAYMVAWGEKAIPLSSFFRISQGMVERVSELHREGGVDRNLCPERFEIKETNESVRVALVQASGWASAETRYAYISPERTGRMNRSLDSRTDLYSLGMIFYEILARQMPYHAESIHDWVYAHLAVQPEPLHQCRPDLPKALCEIVMKLLHKSAMDRYQSAYGLYYDLQLCEQEWKERGDVASFVVGQMDELSQLRFPQVLYGRAKESEQLLAVYERVRNGAMEIVFVSGAAGSGKTALIKEIQMPVIRDRGIFISGKFDQLKQDIPFGPLLDAFRDFIRQIATESTQQIQVWQNKLSVALGPSAFVLTELVPEIKILLGEEPSIQPLPPMETMNWFKLLFLSFIRVIADKQHPLVLFLDDLQWADTDTLDLLKMLANDSTNRNLLVIGTYRDQEIDALTPGGNVHHWHLKPLTYTDVLHFISDMLHLNQDRVSPLARAIFQKTSGNPFYIHQLLYAIYYDKQLYFNIDEACWEWSLDSILGRETPDDVVHFIIGRLNGLPHEALQVLQIAGGIGNTFDLRTLSMVYGQLLEQTLNGLHPSIEEGLLIVNDLETTGGLFTFVHDKVQQAVYDLIADERKNVIHLQIGRCLLGQCSPVESDERIFEIVYHLNTCSGLIEDSHERLQLAELNLAAGKKAKASTAYASALTYFKAGVSCIQSEQGLEQNALIFNLMLEQAECEYLSGNFDQAEAMFKELIRLCTTKVEKVKVYLIQINMHTYRKQEEEAVRLGLCVMAEFGFRIPLKPTRVAIIRELAITQCLLHWKLGSLISLPENHDPEHRALAKIVEAVAASAYIVNPNLTAVFYPAYVKHGLKHGNSEALPFMLGSYATLLCFGFGSYKLGYRLVEMAHKLAEPFARVSLSCKLHFMSGLILQYQHPKEAVEHFRQSVQYGLESREVTYVGFAMSLEVINSMRCLPELLIHCLEYMDNTSHVLDPMTMKLLQVTIQYVQALQGLGEDRLSFSGGAFDENAAFSNEIFDESHKNQFYYYYTCKIEVHYLFGYYEKAISLTKQAAPYAKNNIPVHIQKQCFYHFLALAAIYKHASYSEQKKYRMTMKKQLSRMKKWSKSCPSYAWHKYLLMSAEMERMRGETVRAMKLYDEAIAAAREEGAHPYEAIGNELAAHYYHSVHLDAIAETYLLEACKGYSAWGAMEKVKALCEAYPAILSEFSELKPSASGELVQRMNDISMEWVSSTDHRLDQELDLNTLREARSMAADKEGSTSFAELFLSLAMKNVGAERGYVVLEQEGGWMVEASSHGSKADAVVDREWSSSIIQYVLRTREPIVVGNAFRSIYASDPYINREQVKSILCMPILYSNNRAGALYLENNAAADAFTVDRLEILELLFSQMAHLKSLRAREITQEKLKP